MTAEDVENWKQERDIARKSGNAELIHAAYDHRDDMMLRCIQRQADRIKQGLKNDEEIEKRLDDGSKRMTLIEETVKPLQETAREYNEMKIEARGMRRMWGWLKIAASASGGALILKLLQGC